MFRKVTKVDADAVIRQLLEDNIRLRTERDAFHSQLIVSQNNFEWARLRLNHVEDERAALLYRVLAIAVPTPKIERSGGESMAEPPRQSFDELSRSISFEDVGDAKAQQLGVDHED